MIKVDHKEIASVKGAPNRPAVGFLWLPWAPKGIGLVHGFQVRQGLSVCFQTLLRGGRAAFGGHNVCQMPQLGWGVGGLGSVLS